MLFLTFLVTLMLLLLRHREQVRNLKQVLLTLLILLNKSVTIKLVLYSSKILQITASLNKLAVKLMQKLVVNCLQTHCLKQVARHQLTLK